MKDESREALRRYREAVELSTYAEDDEEITRQSVIVIPGPPPLPTGTESKSKLKSAVLALVTAVSTGAALALAKHWGK